MFLFILILIYMIMFPITVILMLMKILDIVEDVSKSKNTNKDNKTILAKRKHTNIGSSNYNNVFNKRSEVKYNYDDYKNNKGLYEPVTPHKPGVKIHKKED